MRKQYHFWPGRQRLDAWDVDRLIELSRDVPVINVPLSSITDVDSNYWFGDGFGDPTVRNVVDHIRLVQAVDTEFPMILAADGRVMDGMHRVARALLAGQATIKVVRFEITPAPDYQDCSPEELPY